MMAVELGYYGLFVALLAAAWATIASVLAAASRERGLQGSAERSLVVSFAFIVVGYGTKAGLPRIGRHS